MRLGRPGRGGASLEKGGGVGNLKTNGYEGGRGDTILFLWLRSLWTVPYPGIRFFFSCLVMIF